LKAFFRKNDLFLLFGFLLLGGLSVVAVLLYSGNVQTVELSVNGQHYASYPLSEDRTVPVQTEYGRNVVQIRDRQVYVIDSDCTGHDCMHFGAIGNGGQVIMCLPHRLIITITGGPSSGSPEVDAVVY